MPFTVLLPAKALCPGPFLEEGGFQVGLQKDWKGELLGGGAEEWVCPQQRRVGDSWQN